MGRGNQGQDMVFVKRRLGLDDIPQILAAAGGLFRPPPNPAGQIGAQLGGGFVVQPTGPFSDQARGKGNRLIHGDHKHPGPGLGNKAGGVEQHGAAPVSPLCQSVVESPVIIPLGGGQQAGYIFHHQELGLLGGFVQHPQPLPDQAAAGGVDAPHGAGQG